MTPSSASNPSPSRRWRLARRLLVGVAVVATLIAVFYTVENWRGRRAWETARRALEAKGEVLDWSAYIPRTVADDQNFFKAPYMKDWFVKGSLLDLAPSSRPTPEHRPAPFALPARAETNLAVVEVTVVPANAALESPAAGIVLNFDEPSARDQAAQLVRETIGPCVIAARGGTFVSQSPDRFKPVQLVLRARAMPPLKELATFFPRNPFTNSEPFHSDTSLLEVAPAGSNVFRVCLKKPVYGATDYLALTEPLTSNFDLVRKALERPYARIDCAYDEPYAIGIPDFITMRTAVQISAERAQCYLLVGRPEAAWHELSLVHDLCRILMVKPSGKPITLVGAMIDVAIAGLYAGIVEDGVRLHAWREPQLLAIEQQLRETELLAPVVEAFREERAATLRTFEITRRGELVKLFNFGASRGTWRSRLNDAAATVFLTAMPRGWFFQNMALGAGVQQELLGSVDSTNQLVRPSRAERYYHEVQARLKRRSPYNFLVVISLPNFLRAVQTAARNQTLVNQAGVACALERYRLARGQYPNTLDLLTPQFVEKLPHDLIGGRPLQYRRTSEGGYLLYSVGWDEKDDGGVLGNSREEGDWVWQLR